MRCFTFPWKASFIKAYIFRNFNSVEIQHFYTAILVVIKRIKNKTF